MKKLLIIFTLLSGYSFGQSVGEGIGYQGVIKTPQYNFAPAKKFVFTKDYFPENDNKKIYMGCVSCPEYESHSIFNKDGMYGRNSLSNYSIWNKNSPYCALKVTHIVVDENGKYYGTLDEYMQRMANR